MMYTRRAVPLGTSQYIPAAPRAAVMQIDFATYRKDVRHPPRWGYQSRGNVAPSSIVIHTTNNRKPTSFEHEAVYLRDSADVGAHFLIGKDGRIVQFLDPVRWQAWHAGECLPAWANPKSIGIEHHVSVGEAWTPTQRAACTWLVQEMMRAYGIAPAMVETHRAVARPIGRKSDPEGWGDQAFYLWRATLSPVSLPSDPFDAWGSIGRPEGEARGYAIPRAWLVNKKLGKCIRAETYSASGAYSIAEFERGIIVYMKARNTTLVELF